MIRLPYLLMPRKGIIDHFSIPKNMPFKVIAEATSDVTFMAFEEVLSLREMLQIIENGDGEDAAFFCSKNHSIRQMIPTKDIDTVQIGFWNNSSKPIALDFEIKTANYVPDDYHSRGQF